MDTKDWEMLVAIYEEQKLSKAAERLFITQPALSYRLQQLEKEFGVKIFTRTGKLLRFTFEGEYLLGYARKMLDELRKTKDALSGLSADVEGKLRIGVPRSYAQYSFPAVLKGFLDTYPNVQIEMKTGWSSEIFQLVESEDIHLGIIRGNYSWFEQKYLINEEQLCVIYNKPVQLDELPKLPRIYYTANPNRPKMNYRTDPLLAKSIDNWWQERFSEPPSIAMEVDSIETCKEMVRNGLGYAIIPRFCLKEYDSFHTIDIKYKNGQVLVRNTWVIYKNASATQPLVQKFVHFLKST